MTLEKMYWQRPDGGTLDLTDGVKYNVRAGIDGRFMPPFEFVSDAVYNYPGEVVRSRKTKPRQVTIPIIVMGANSADLRANLRFLTNAFGQMFDVGKLKVVTDDARTYMLNCYFSSGMTLEESYDTGDSRTWRIFDATFTAYDPYWFNPVENDVSWWGPLTGLAGDHTVYNNGDVDAWPIWTITGPCTNVVITQQDTDDYISITYSLSNYWSFIYVDTRPLNRSVLWNHNTNIFSSVNVGSRLFPLVPGANTINIAFTQTYNPNTWASCRWVDRYYGV